MSWPSSPVVDLTLVLLGLYALEGVRWVPNESIAFARRPWGGYAVRGTIRIRERSKGALLLPEPWVPCLERFIVQPSPTAEGLDPESVRRRLEGVRAVLGAATWLPWLLAGHTLFLGPLAAYLLGWGQVVVFWIGGHLLLTLLAATATVRAARREPTLASAGLLELVVPIVIYPPATLRFVEKLVANALSGVDPLAVASVLLDREPFAEMARSRMRRSRSSGNAGSIEAAAPQLGLKAEDLVDAPSREAGSIAYCPQCHAQYRAGLERCSDCGGVTLIPF